VNSLTPSGRYRGLCALHPDFKPLVCALSPLAREVEVHGSVETELWSFVSPVPGCPGEGRGPRLPVEAPDRLRGRLDAEAVWMRVLIEATPELKDEAAAWTWMASRAVTP